MVHTFSTVRGVCTVLVVITMFGSMLLTNDTALLTFLPLGWFVLSVNRAGKARCTAVHSPELRRQPLRNDHPLRQSPESLPFQLLQHPCRNVLFRDAAAEENAGSSVGPQVIRTVAAAKLCNGKPLMPSVERYPLVASPVNSAWQLRPGHQRLSQFHRCRR